VLSHCPACRQSIDLPLAVDEDAKYRCECGSVATGEDYEAGRFVGVLYIFDEILGISHDRPAGIPRKKELKQQSVSTGCHVLPTCS